MGLGPSLPQCEPETPQPASQLDGQSACAARQPSSTPGSAAHSRQNAAGAQGGQPTADAPPRPAGAAAGQAGDVGAAPQVQGGEADVDELMSLLLGSGVPQTAEPGDCPALSTARGTAPASSSGGLGSRRGSAAAAASPALPSGMLTGQQQQPVSDWQLAAAMQQEEVAAALAATRGSSSSGTAVASCDDWRLAATLQEEEDAAAAAAAEAAAADAAVAAAEDEAARDEQLARQWQEEEDARVAAALAAEEQAAVSDAATAAAAASSANFWSALHLHDPEEEAADGGLGAFAAAAGQRRQGAPGGAAAVASSSTCGGAPLDGGFPSLQAAASGSSGRRGGPGSNSLRQALLRDHRSAAQRAQERGSGVRLLHRADASGSPAARPPLHPGGGGSWLGSPAVEGGGWGAEAPGGLPPLRLDDGGQLLEDDLDYQLLLRVSSSWFCSTAACKQRYRVGCTAASTPVMRAACSRGG